MNARYWPRVQKLNSSSRKALLNLTANTAYADWFKLLQSFFFCYVLLQKHRMKRFWWNTDIWQSNDWDRWQWTHALKRWVGDLMMGCCGLQVKRVGFTLCSQAWLAVHSDGLEILGTALNLYTSKVWHLLMQRATSLLPSMSSRPY